MSGPAQRRVFAIDDDEIILLSLRHVLEKAGYELHAFQSGQEALAAFETSRPQMVFVDLRMPGMDGFEVIRRLLKIDPGLPIVVVTGFASISTAVEAMKAGAYDFLAKPFTPDELRLVAERCFERWRLINEARNLKREKDEVTELNRRLTGLYAMVQAVGAAKKLEPVLKIVASEVAAVMDVPITTVKFVSEDGQTLRYAAAHGLPGDFLAKSSVIVARSAAIRRVLAGEALVTGSLADHGFQLEAGLAAAGIRSVLFASLKAEERVTGILGAYSTAGQFNDADTRFFRRAADIASIAIEDARQRDAIDSLLRERTRFMLQVAHNMRAPLDASASMIEALVDGYAGELEEKPREYLNRLRGRLHGMGQMVTELLTLARAQSHETPIERAPCDLKAVVEKAVAVFREEAAKKSLTLSLSAAAEPLMVVGDGGVLGQMAENLISNAIKYSRSGGVIDVVCERAGADWVVLEVRDTGIGIPEVDQPRLFEEFFRASNARKLHAVGTGLGLSIVQQTVSRHGGRVRFRSSEGQGTTFTVELPASR